MAEGKRVQFSTLATAAAYIVVVVALLVRTAEPLTGPVGNDVSNQAIKDSALGSVFVWCWCWPLAFAKGPTNPGGISIHRHGARAVWTLGCVLLLLHIAVAFHLGHGWSHEAAWQHTRQAGGYGDGIYVNYAFALVWLADVIWAWVSFDSYLNRPRWLKWSIHCFLAFVVFNAAVVFGSWDSRLVFLISFGIVLTLLALGKWSEPKQAAQPTADEESDRRP